MSQEPANVQPSDSTPQGGASTRPSPEETSPPAAPDILESLPGGVIVLDAAGRITYVNHTAERMLGGERAELTGRDVRQAYPPALGLSLFELSQRALSGSASQEQALFFPSRGLWLGARASPLPGDGVVVALSDITEHKRLEDEGARELRRERALLRQAETRRGQALRNATRLRRLMDSQLIGVTISDSGRIVEANSVFLDMLGYTPEDFPSGGIPWATLIPPEAAERNRAASRELITVGECAPYETELYRKDGSLVPVRIGAVRPKPGESEAVGVVVDLSAYKRLERALAQRAGELDATIEAIADGVLLYNARGGLMRLNQAARAMLSVTSVDDYKRHSLAERIRLLNIRRIDGQPIIPEQASIWAMLEEISRTGGAPLELSLRALDGREIAIEVTVAPIHDAQGGLTGVVVVMRDITARQHLEQALMETNSRLVKASNEADRRAQQWLTIIETIADGVIVLDREGRIAQVNKTMRLMLGVGDQPIDAFADLPFEQWRERYAMRDSSGELFVSDAWPIARVLDGERLIGGAAIDMLVRSPIGVDVMISVSGAPIRDERGEISGAVFVIRDVTERIAHERERIETLDNVAHELNSPLTSLNMLTQIITRSGRLAPSQITRLNQSVSQLLRLSEDLRAAHGLERSDFPLNRQPADLCELCAHAAEEQMAQVGRDVRIFLPDHPVYANVDAIRISQALTNLISNAFKYGPRDRPVTVRLFEADGVVRIETHDEGPGIAPEVQRRLFERFYRAPDVKKSYSGIGLGLYITRRFIELHGGRIGVESAPGKGTTFWFTLPLHTD